MPPISPAVPSTPPPPPPAPPVPPDAPPEPSGPPSAPPFTGAPELSATAVQADTQGAMTNGNFVAAHLVDGTTTTAWECKWDAANNEQTAALLTITLSEAAAVDQIRIEYGGGSWPGSSMIPVNVAVAVDGTEVLPASVELGIS